MLITRYSLHILSSLMSKYIRREELILFFNTPEKGKTILIRDPRRFIKFTFYSLLASS